MALLSKLIGVVLMIFAFWKLPPGAFQDRVFEMGAVLIGVSTGAYVLGRSIRKIGQPVQPAPEPADDAAAAKVVGG